MKVKDIMELIRERKWDSLIILVLLIIIGVTIPLATSYAMSKGLQEGLAPINDTIESMDERIRTIDERTLLIQKGELEEITSRGIQAYKKIFTIEDLENNTQNSASIEIALRHPESYNVLFQIDRERTLLFEQYFCHNYMLPPISIPPAYQREGQ